MKKYEINRRAYKEIKRMDHEQMSTFCSNIYLKGYEAGKKDAAGLSESEVEKTILQIKGIGEKKARDIIEALTNANREKDVMANG